jgi:hypothetical protein
VLQAFSLCIPPLCPLLRYSCTGRPEMRNVCCQGCQSGTHPELPGVALLRQTTD